MAQNYHLKLAIAACQKLISLNQRLMSEPFLPTLPTKLRALGRPDVIFEIKDFLLVQCLRQSMN